MSTDFGWHTIAQRNIHIRDGLHAEEIQPDQGTTEMTAECNI